MITQAIANHEAFQPVRVLDNSEAQLLSDALYGADKFRWGPENFADTLWDILESRKLEDLSLLYKRFPRGLEGIRQIRSTFEPPPAGHMDPISSTVVLRSEISFIRNGGALRNTTVYPTTPLNYSQPPSVFTFVNHS